jgi:hypothetical protein
MYDDDGLYPDDVNPAMIEKMLADFERYILTHERLDGKLPDDGPRGGGFIREAP